MASFGALPAQEAHALALIVFGGCTFAEAAVLLTLPVSEVRRRAVDGFRAMCAAAGVSARPTGS